MSKWGTVVQPIEVRPVVFANPDGGFESLGVPIGSNGLPAPPPPPPAPTIADIHTFPPVIHGQDDHYISAPSSNTITRAETFHAIARGVDSNGVQIGRFSSGLMDCFRNVIPSCVSSHLTPCVLFGQINHRIGLGHCVPNALLYACFYVPLLLSYFGIVIFQKYSQLFLIVLVLLTMNLRVKFRSKFRIPMARHAFRYGLMSGSSVPAHFSLAAPPVLPPTRLNAVRLPVHANLIHTGPMSGMAGQQGYQVVYFGDYPLEYGRQLPQMQQAGYALA